MLQLRLAFWPAVDRQKMGWQRAIGVAVLMHWIRGRAPGSRGRRFQRPACGHWRAEARFWPQSLFGRRGGDPWRNILCVHGATGLLPRGSAQSLVGNAWDKGAGGRVPNNLAES